MIYFLECQHNGFFIHIYIYMLSYMFYIVSYFNQTESKLYMHGHFTDFKCINLIFETSIVLYYFKDDNGDRIYHRNRSIIK